MIFEDEQLPRFRKLIPTLASNPFYSRKLSEFDLMKISSYEEFSALPFTTKDELSHDQSVHAPYGSNLSQPLNQYTRFHQTSGTSSQPLRWLDTPSSWSWILDCWDDIYNIVEVTSDSRLFFPFSFGPFIGFWAAFEASARRGSFSLSGGGMSTTARLDAIITHQIDTVCCTPTYAIRLGTVAAETGIDLADSTVHKLIVAGEPGGSIPNVRNRIEELWGATVYDHSGMTEIGSMTIECGQSTCNPHVIETAYIVECLDEDQKPVSDSEYGELVITNLGRTGSPLIRYRTGDRACIDRSPCECGRNWARLRGGILGRVDDMIHIKGNNVYPSNIENIVRALPGVEEFRLIVTRNAGMNELAIEIETGPEAPDNIDTLLRDAVRDRYHFSVPVNIVQDLPRFEMKARRLVLQDETT